MSRLSELEQEQINDYIKEYLKYWDLNQSLESFQDQLKSKQNKRNVRNSAETKLQSMMRSPASKTKTEQQLQKEYKLQNKKYSEVLQAGRQIFSVSINLLQIIHNIKQGNQKYESLNEAIENYKIQLGKHHKVIINQGKVQGTDLISDTIIREHKAKLEKHVAENNVQGIVQTLLSLRVNALQIAPELRKNLVQQLIRRDIFKITQDESFKFLTGILGIKSKSLKHAITSLISVIASTTKGIEYLTFNGNDIVIHKIIKILQEQDHGSVTQRFCLAILQKCSVKQTLMGAYLDHDLINWVLKLVKTSFTIKIHMFCLDFATAMLANILHSKWCQLVLSNKSQTVVTIMDTLLKFIMQEMEVSVLMHLLIALSYLCKQKFQREMEEANVRKRISEFMHYYENTYPADGQAAQMDKKTVLDLCAHMFHNKEEEFDNEERIREYENGQGELIFECFQDQVS